MNGDQSMTKRTNFRRRSVIANDAIPAASQTKTKACDVGTPNIAIIAEDASPHAAGAPTLTTRTPATLKFSRNGGEHHRPRPPDRRPAGRDRRLDQRALPPLR